MTSGTSSEDVLLILFTGRDGDEFLPERFRVLRCLSLCCGILDLIKESFRVRWPSILPCETLYVD